MRFSRTPVASGRCKVSFSVVERDCRKVYVTLIAEVPLRVSYADNPLRHAPMRDISSDMLL